MGVGSPNTLLNLGSKHWTLSLVPAPQKSFLNTAFKVVSAYKFALNPSCGIIRNNSKRKKKEITVYFNS